MSRLQFTRATREQKKARIGIIGPAGSGKTKSSLLIASALGQRIALIDSERGSSAAYAGDGVPFDVLHLGTFSPQLYTEAIEQAGADGYDVLIVDGLSAAWAGVDGALEQVDRIAKRSQSKNSFVAWREVTPLHNRLVDALVSCPMHLIATMRSKMEYVLESVEGKDGKASLQPKKVGMAPIQREGLEYEFDIVGDMTLDHDWLVSKTRCSRFDKAVISMPGVEFGEQVLEWLSVGEPPQQRVVATAPQQPEPRRPRHAADRGRAQGQGAHGGIQPPPPSAAASDSMRPPALAPAPTQPCFSRAGDWSGKAEWAGRPLHEASIVPLQEYARVLEQAIRHPRNRARVRALEVHRADVAEALRFKHDEQRAAEQETSDHTLSSADDGWDLSGEGSDHDDQSATSSG
jgi:AAA domain